MEELKKKDRKEKAENFAKEIEKLDEKEQKKLFYVMQGMKLAKEAV